MNDRIGKFTTLKHVIACRMPGFVGDREVVACALERERSNLLAARVENVNFHPAKVAPLREFARNSTPGANCRDNPRAGAG